MTTSSISYPSMVQSASFGAALVLAAALVWSTGGLLARIADIDNPWIIVFWRTGIASIFLLVLMLWREGVLGTWNMMVDMGVPGLAIAACFATASTCFVIALQYTTVANILLMQAGVPLIAAGMSWVLFREPVQTVTWIAIAAVIGGVTIMVSDSITGKVSPIGDGLALIIAFAFAGATVITRRYSNIRMTPAIFFGAAIGWLASVVMTYGAVPELAVPALKLGILIVYGLTLGVGMLLFTIGARLIPSSYAALLGTAETIAGPLWVWVFLSEIPAPRTIFGGSIILVSILLFLAWQISGTKKSQRVVPKPN